MDNNLPPTNIEAEEAILGGILLDPGAMARIADSLVVEAFSIESHQEIYRVAQQNYHEGKPTDFMAVSTYLSDRKLLDKVGGTAKLAQLLNRTVSAVNIDRYTALVMDKFTRRQLIHAGHEIVDLGYDAVPELEAILDQSEQKIFQISDRLITSTTDRVAQISMDCLNELESDNPIYETGLYDLDKLMVGFEPGTMTILAGRPSMGKCCHGDTEILLSDGSLTKIETLVQRQKGQVFTLETDWKIKSAIPEDFIDNGIKPVYRVTTRLGRVIQTTITHPYLTITGWQPLENLKCGDKIAVPRKLAVFGGETIRACEAKLLGYLIGDGSIAAPNRIKFTNANPVIGQDFCQAITEFSSALQVKAYSKKTKAIDYSVATNLEFVAQQRKEFALRLLSLMKTNSVVNQRQLAGAINTTQTAISRWVNGRCLPDYQTFHALCQYLVVEPQELIPSGFSSAKKNGKNVLNIWLDKLGLSGKNAHKKTIPKIVFKLKRELVAIFLNRLFATDGWATVLSSGQSQLGYCTVSEKLARQVQHLLLRFGIIATLKHRQVKYKDSTNPAWQLDITDAKSIETFIAEIGIFGKEEALNRVRQALSKRRYQTNRDLIPVEIWQQLAIAKGDEPWSVLAKRAGIRGHSNIHVGKRAVSRARLLILATALGDANLSNLAQSDVYWDEIVAIEEIGNHRVYDLTIPKTHNFIANDICIHNSAIANFFTLQMATKHQLPAVYFSLEMTKKQLQYRLWSLISESRSFYEHNLVKIQGDRLRMQRAGRIKLSQDELDSIAKIVGICAELPIFINDNRGISVAGIASECRRIKAREGNLGLVVVDYLQMMAGEHASGNRSYDLGDVARSLYKLAGELNVPILALSQVSRGVEQRQDKRPMMSDLSGILEMVADNILFAYRDEYYNADTSIGNLLELILAKARHGETGKVELLFDKSCGMIDSLVEYEAMIRS